MIAFQNEPVHETHAKIFESIFMTFSNIELIPQGNKNSYNK